MQSQRGKSASIGDGGYEWDVFISHASEDKPKFVDDLVMKLKEQELRVWYDADTLKLGDGLEETIESGIEQTRFGIVILSPTYFSKEWTLRELSLLLRHRPDTILPIRYNITADDVNQLLPDLSNLLSVDGMQYSIAGRADPNWVVIKVLEALGREYKFVARPRKSIAIWPNISLCFGATAFCAMVGAVWVTYVAAGQSCQFGSFIQMVMWLGQLAFVAGPCVGAFAMLSFIINDDSTRRGSLGEILQTFVFVGISIPIAAAFMISAFIGALFYLFNWSVSLTAFNQVALAGFLSGFSALGVTTLNWWASRPLTLPTNNRVNRRGESGGSEINA